MIRSVIRPGLWLPPIYDCLIGGLPLAAAAGVAIGFVIWMHTRDVLARSGSGAVEYLPTVLSAAVLLELAPLGAGLILAARTSARLGAELASMKIHEQIDALELLGASPWRYLIGPRLLAVTLAAPLLHVLIAALALGSGYIAELLHGPTTWLRYSQALLAGVRLDETVAAGLKTPIFGLLAALAGCGAGVMATGGADGVGRAATRGVVLGILLVLAADVALVALIRALLS